MCVQTFRDSRNQLGNTRNDLLREAAEGVTKAFRAAGDRKPGTLPSQRPSPPKAKARMPSTHTCGSRELALSHFGFPGHGNDDCALSDRHCVLPPEGYIAYVFGDAFSENEHKNHDIVIMPTFMMSLCPPDGMGETSLE